MIRFFVQRFARFLILLCVVMPHAGISQERTSGGAADVQVTWQALSNMVKATETKTTAILTRVDQIGVCGNDGRLYAPGQNGTINGCAEAKTLDGTTLTQVETLAKSVDVKVTKMMMLECNKLGMLFDGSKCIAKQ